MAIRYLLPQLAYDFDLLAYRASVQGNGGDVSVDYMGQLQTFMDAEKVSGAWGLTDDYLFLWADNAAAALTSLKQRRLAVVVDGAVFTPSRGYDFNGTSQYIDMGFTPSTNGINCTSTNQRIGVYERTNVSSSGVSMGTLTSAARNLLITSRNGTAATSRVNTASQSFTLSVADSRGFKATSRAGGGLVVKMFDRGVKLTDSTAASTSATNPSFPIFVGALNNAGTAASFRASSVGMGVVGGPLSDAQEAAQQNSVQALATARGANV